MEIAPGIHRIKATFGANRMVYVHLLIGSHASMLIDTGCAGNPDADIVPYMHSIGFDPATLNYILISHSDVDHQGGNAPMKRHAPNAILLCHNLDRTWIEDTEALILGRYAQFEQDHDIGYGDAGKADIRADCLSAPIDLTLEGGERFYLSPDWYIEVIHAPGHSFGHLVVYDPRSKTLISGEAAIWTAILADDWTPTMPPTYCQVDTYLATIARLAAMDIEIMSPAHWRVQRGAGDVGAFLRESRDFCVLIEHKLMNLAHAGAAFTLRDAIERISPAVATWTPPVHQDFSYGMLGNLVSLTGRGLLTTERNERGLVTWSLPI
ncbi:MAG: MBL fold metallo-hydrolase [Chloroflexota bacterium]|nr:MBL fold metallo-hydrolase [Chloroflexota bacterium]